MTNMRQFNLEEYLANPKRKIIAQDGRSVRIVCTDYKYSVDKECIIALAKDNSCNSETIVCATKDGRCLSENKSDVNLLFFAPKKKVYPFKEGDRVLVRDSDTVWNFDYFDSYREESFYPYMGRYAPHEQCIPLNEHTWKLLGTTDEYKEETTD